jgi:tetratricopeptide (TPR) repeat protein
MADKEWKPQVRKVGGDERNRLQAIQALIRDQRFEEAHEELARLVNENKKSFRPHFMMATLYQRQRKFPEALECFKKALAIDGQHPQALVRAGQCSLFIHKDKKDKHEEAERYFSQALEMEPNNADAHVGMAQVLQRSGAESQAIELLQQTLKIDPQMARARILLARLLHKAGKTKDATAELESFVGTDPDSSIASTLLARAYNAGGREDEAVEVLESVARLYPTNSNIWVELGRLRLSQEDYPGAEEAFREAAKHGQQELVGSIQMFRALLPQGKFDQARDAIKNVPRRGPLAPLVHKCYGDIYAAQGHYDDAMKSYRASLMHGESGQKLLTQIEKEAVSKSDPEENMKRYQAAVEKLAVETRENRTQRKQQGRLQRFASRRRAGGAARPGP